MFAWEEGLVEKCRYFLASVLLLVNVADKWSWNNIRGGSYLAKETYYVICDEFVEGVPTSLFQSLVWHPYIATKVSLFASRIFQNRLHTRDNSFSSMYCSFMSITL